MITLKTLKVCTSGNSSVFFFYFAYCRCTFILASGFEENHRNVSSFATFVSLLLRLGKDRVTMPQTPPPSSPAPLPGVCVTCGGGEDEGTLRTCDGCDRDFHCHAHCHWPPIEGAKLGDWRARPRTLHAALPLVAAHVP